MAHKIDLLEQLKSRRKALVDFLERSPDWPADAVPPRNGEALRLWSLPHYGIFQIGSKASMSKSTHQRWRSETQRRHKEALSIELGELEDVFKRVKARLQSRVRSPRKPLKDRLASTTEQVDQATRDRDAALASYGELLGRLEKLAASKRSLEHQCEALKRDNERLQARIDEAHGFPRPRPSLRAVDKSEPLNDA